MKKDKKFATAILPEKYKLSLLSIDDYESTASCINNKNEILLTIHKPFTESYIYRNGKSYRIPVKSGNLCYAASINDYSEVVGCFGTEFHLMNAYYYKDGKMTVLPSLGGSACAASINKNGMIAGYSKTREGRQCAVIWKNGKIINIGSKLPGESILYDVNNDGVCVGYFTEKGKPATLFLYKDGLIDVIKSQSDCYSTAINNQNHIVGFMSKKNKSSAFLYGNDKFHLPGIKSIGDSKANDINDSNVIVGFYIEKSKVQNGFIWKDRNIYNLNSLTESDYNIVSAQAINGNNLIVGQCALRNKLHACLLIPK